MSTRLPVTVYAPSNAPMSLSARRTDDATAAKLYTSVSATSELTQPIAVAAGASTTVYVDGPSVYYVSALVGGIEMAAGYGSRRRIEADGGQTEISVGEPGLPAAYRTIVVSGTLSVAAGVVRYPFPYAVTLLGVSLNCNTAPTGAAILVDINKNGTTVFTTQGSRPTIAISAFATAAEVTNADVTAFAAGDYITVDVDQVGSGAAGANLTVTIRYQ